MIIFQGDISKECQEYFLKKIVAGILIFTSILTLITLFVCLIIGNNLFSYLILIAGLITIVAYDVYMVKNYKKTFPRRVDIEEDFLVVYTKEGSVTREVKDLKRVFDEGQFYIMDFYFPHKCMEMLCQKDLIVQGTLEEFEELFEDYLVKK